MRDHNEDNNSSGEELPTSCQIEVPKLFAKLKKKVFIAINDAFDSFERELMNVVATDRQVKERTEQAHSECEKPYTYASTDQTFPNATESSSALSCQRDPHQNNGYVNSPPQKRQRSSFIDDAATEMLIADRKQGKEEEDGKRQALDVEAKQAKKPWSIPKNKRKPYNNLIQQQECKKPKHCQCEVIDLLDENESTPYGGIDHQNMTVAAASNPPVSPSSCDCPQSKRLKCFVSYRASRHVYSRRPLPCCSSRYYTPYAFSDTGP